MKKNRRESAVDVKTPDRELSACTFSKTCLMLLVLFYHSILYFSGTWFTRDPAEVSVPLTYLARWLNTFHIYGFALVSGYLFYHGRFERSKYPTYLGFLAVKAKRLLLPYAVVAALWVAPIHWYFFRCPTSELVDKYLLGKSASQLWFLLMLFGVFAIVYPLAEFFRKHTLLGALVALSSYAASLYLPWRFLSYYGLRNALAYLSVFFLGFVLRQYRKAAPVRLLHRVPAAVPVLLHVGLFALWQHLSTLTFHSAAAPLLMQALRLAVTTGGALMAYLSLRRLAFLVRWERPAFWHLSRCSMPIYLFHQQIVYVLVTLLDGTMSPYLQVPIVTVGALSLSWALSELLLKFRYTRPLIGEKM